MTLDEVEKEFRKIVRELLGLAENSVRKANPPKPGPVGNDPFVTVLFTLLDSTGQDDNRWEPELVNDVPTNNVIEIGEGGRLLNVSVQFFMTGAKWNANRLKTLLQMEGATAKLQAIGLGLARIGGVVDVSNIVDTAWEERAQLTLELHAVAKETIITPTYGTFPITVNTGTEESSTSFEVHEP